MSSRKKLTLQDTLAESSQRRVARSVRLSALIIWPGRIAFLLAIMLSPWMVGSVNSTAQLVVAICLLISLAFWWFETAVNPKSTQALPYVVFLVAAGLLIALVQTTPLPEFAQGLLGRQVELYERYSLPAERMVESAAAEGQVYISIDRESTWHQIRLLLIAIAALALGCRYFRRPDSARFFLWAITLNGVALSLFGMIQRLTFNGKLYWVFELTTGGSPFGPFVNRNNCAGYLLMCLAAAVGLCVLLLLQKSERGPRPIFSGEMPVWRRASIQFLAFLAELNAAKVAALLSTVVIITGVVGAFSRGGAVALLAAVVFTFLFYGMARKPDNVGLLLVPIFLVVAGLSSWIGFSEGLMERFERKGDLEQVWEKEARIQSWSDTWPAGFEMGALGSGLGSYPSVHRMYRTDHEQSVNRFAENQYFQGWIEGGFPALILFLLAWYIGFHSAFLLLTRGQSPLSVVVGTGGIFLLTAQAVHSFVDFGFYITANLVCMSAMTGFLSGHAQSFAKRIKARSWLGYEFPGRLLQITLLTIFAGLVVSSMTLYRLSRVERAMLRDPNQSNQNTLDREATDRQIQVLAPLVEKARGTRGLNHLAGLWVHRSRLGFYQQLATEIALLNLPPDQQSETEATFWALTSLSSMHEKLIYLKNNESAASAAAFRNEAFIADNLRIARQYYLASQQIRPMQAHVFIRLGKINALIGDDEPAGLDMERAVELTPNNSSLRLSTGMFYLRTGNINAAAVHLRRFLELVPGSFRQLVELLTDENRQEGQAIDERVIFETIVPDDPDMLFQFASNYLDPNSPLYQDVLSEADDLIGTVQPVDPRQILLQANIKLASGLKSEALELLRALLIIEPRNLPERFKLARLQLEVGELEDAEANARYLVKANRRRKDYKDLLETIQDEIDRQK